MEEIRKLFETGVQDIRRVELEARNYKQEQFEDNRKKVIKEVAQIVNNIKVK